jgi:hypothetical protein
VSNVIVPPITLSEFIKRLQEAEATFGGHRNIRLCGHYGATTALIEIEENQVDAENLWLSTDLSTG